jgi:LDH2 family malate/lactate/ureidoglycolate dehydrogenase
MAERWPASGAGGTVLAIHVDSVIPQDIFRAESDRMVRDVRNTYDPMPGYDRALLPGAIEEESRARHRAEGIRYGEMEQKNAREVSERLNVPLPWD